MVHVTSSLNKINKVVELPRR